MADIIYNIYYEFTIFYSKPLLNIICFESDSFFFQNLKTYVNFEFIFDNNFISDGLKLFISNNKILFFQDFFFFFSYIYTYIFTLFFFTLLNYFMFLYKPMFFNVNIFMVSMLTELEKELNSIDDVIYIFLIFMSLFFFNFFCSPVLISTIHYNIIIFCVLLNVQLILLTVPFSLLIDYGFYFIIFIRGGTTSSIVLYECILDYVNIIAYYLRIIIQVVRVVVIITTFYTFSELYLEYYYYFYNIFFSYQGFSSFSSNILWYLMFFSTHWVLEFIHLIFIFLLQTVAFNVMVLWLFQFLFTLFFIELLEFYFFKYRI